MAVTSLASHQCLSCSFEFVTFVHNVYIVYFMFSFACCIVIFQNTQISIVGYYRAYASIDAVMFYIAHFTYSSVHTIACTPRWPAASSVADMTLLF